jgi:Fic family protein
MIYRAKNNSERQSVNLTVIRDERLSHQAVGLFIRMLAQPNDTKFSVEFVSTLSDVSGGTATRTALKELIDLGYVARETIRKNGKVAWAEYNLFEEPNQK